MARPVALLAEDDVDIRTVFASFLEVLGYDVVVAGDGAEMLERLADTRVDVVIADVQMPAMNGLSVVEELRADGWQQPIVVVSAFDDKALTARVRNLKRCAFLAKPFDPSALGRTLDRLRAAPGA